MLKTIRRLNKRLGVADFVLFFSDLYGPTASTDEQRLTPPPEFSSEADRVAKVPTTPRNQKVNVNQPDQHRIIDSSREFFLQQVFIQAEMS